VDYWSVGVIMYILLCGYPPFWGETEAEISEAILNDEVHFDEEDWDHVSQETRNVVLGLLDKNPKKRRTTEDVINFTFRVHNKKVSFAKAFKNFKKNVVKRKLTRQSMGMFERESKKMVREYGKDDNHMTEKNKQEKLSSKQSIGKKGSKCAEDLMPALTPIEDVEDEEKAF